MGGMGMGGIIDGGVVWVGESRSGRRDSNWDVGVE